MVDGEHPNTIGDHRGRPARPIQGDRVLAVTANRTGARWAAVDDGGDQPAVHCPPTNPIAPRQIPQAQAAVPVEVSELRGRRADTVAGSRGAPGNAPTLETDIHQVGATAQPIGDLRRRVTPRVQANDLLIADIGADSGRARPARDTRG